MASPSVPDALLNGSEGLFVFLSINGSRIVEVDSADLVHDFTVARIGARRKRPVTGFCVDEPAPERPILYAFPELLAGPLPAHHPVTLHNAPTIGG